MAALAVVTLCVVAAYGSANSLVPKRPADGGGSPAGSPPSGHDPLPRHGAAKVKHPMNVDASMNDPCSVLTEHQLEGLDVAAAGHRTKSGYGPTCTWLDDQGPTGATMRGGDHPAPNYDHPCGVALKLARQMVKTMKGAQ